MNININKENKNERGFFDQRGFIELIEDKEIIAISSGWHCNGCLYVYRCKDEKWVGSWESEETFPIESSLELQEEFYKAESIRLSTANLVSLLLREGVQDIVGEEGVLTISREITRNLEISKDEINEIEIKITPDREVWNRYYYGDSDEYIYNGDVWNRYTWTPKTHGETNGFQWCITQYEDDSYCSSPSEECTILCLYIPNKFGTEDKELIEIIEKFNIK